MRGRSGPSALSRLRPSVPKCLPPLTLTLTLSLCLPAVARGEIARDDVTGPHPLTLQESIDTALEKNLDIRIVRTDRQIAGFRLDEAAAAFDPALIANSGYGDRLEPIGGSDLTGAVQNRTNRGDGRVGVEKNLATGGAISLNSEILDRRETNSEFARLNPEFNASLNLSLRQPLLKDAGFTYNLAPIRLAELDVDRSNLETLNNILFVLRDTEQAYWLVVSTGRALEIRQNSIALGKMILEESIEREKASLATRVDVLEARASVAENEEALLVAQKFHDDAKDLLFKIMGILREEEPGDLRLESLPVNAFFDPDPQASFDVALRQAPAVLLQLNALHALEIERRRARNQTLPGLDLNATSGLLGRDTSQSNAFDRVAEANGYFWEVMLEFRLPWGRRAEKARYAEAVTLLERERLVTSDVKLDLYSDIRTACRQIQVAHESLKATRVTAELNAERFEQTQSERRSGQATMRDLLEAQEDMEESQLRHLEAQVRLLQAITDLAQLEGTLPRRYGLVFKEQPAPPAE